MINAIIDAISIALYEEFGYENHSEEVKQELTVPCFYIFCLNPEQTLFLGKRYFSQYMYCIQYFPELVSKNAECNAVLERLFQCMEYIEIAGSMVRGSKMRSEMIDGVLNFFVNFDKFFYIQEDLTKMNELQITKTDVKG